MRQVVLQHAPRRRRRPVVRAAPIEIGPARTEKAWPRRKRAGCALSRAIFVRLISIGSLVFHKGSSRVATPSQQTAETGVANRLASRDLMETFVIARLVKAGLANSVL